MRIAKPRLDFGLYTNDLDGMLAFWQGEVGLEFDEVLPVGRGVRQHRHALNGSVFKLNHSRDPLPAEPRSGYRELLIARPGLPERRSLVDPDGNRVTLVPPGEGGVDAIGIRLAVSDASAQADFYARIMEFEEAGERSFRLGDTLLSFEAEPGIERSGEMRAGGYRYCTLQVWDVDEAHAEITSRGGEEAHPPMTLGKVARLSFVRDPDGNWIEISQRASLTGEI
jgi:catechol 2,3-dioxygenase-like lactoylglutathione lyase family enzyme